MATYISNGSGDWTTIPWLTAATGTFTPTAPAAGSPPSFGYDKIVIRQGNNVTYNTSGVFGDGSVGNTIGTVTPNIASASIILSGGRLRASRTQNTGLTALGTIWVAAGTAATANSFLDWGTLSDPVSSFSSTISLSCSRLGSAIIYIQSSSGSTATFSNSACFCGIEKTRNTFLTLPANANQNIISVDSCTNWANNDLIIIESDTTSTTRSLSARISSVDFNNKQVTLDTNLNFARLSGTRVGNFTSTVTVKSLESSPLAVGFLMLGGTNSIYQFSNITLENFTPSWVRADTGGSAGPNINIQTNIGALFYISTFNLTQPVLRKIACLQTHPTGSQGAHITIADVPFSETVLDDISIFSSGGGSAIMNISTNTIVKALNSVSYRCSLPIVANGFRTTLENCYLNAESGIFSNDLNAVNLLVNNSRLRSNSQLFNFDNSNSGKFNSCSLIYGTGRFILSNNNNAYGTFTFSDCTISNPVSSYAFSTPTARTVSDASVNIFNPNNNDTYTAFNYFYHATTNSSIRKNGITSLSFRPKVPNTEFVKTFIIPAIQGVPQKIKGNLRFDSAYGTTTPPSITFGGAVANTTFTSPANVNTWNSFEYDLTPTFTGDLEITVTGTSTLSTGYVYLDGLNLDPFIKDTRWYGFEVDKNAYRTVDINTTLTENQVSAYPYIRNLDFLYDECRYWTVTNPTVSSYIDLVNKVGKTLDFSNRSILLDSQGLSSISYNSNTNLLTLSTFNLSAGNNFNAIQTTGGITVNDNSNISNITLVGSVSGTTARDLNSVIIDGTLTYNTNVDAVITYSSSNIKKVENNGSGVITLNRVNSVVDEAGRNVVVLDNPTYINITNLDGGYIAIFDNNDIIRYYTNQDQTIILPNGSTGTWSYKIGKYNYKTISGTFSIGNTININPIYIRDIYVYEEFVNVASSYNIFKNVQEIYDYFSYFSTTSSGLSFSNLYSYRNALDLLDNALIIDVNASPVFSYDNNIVKIKSSNLESGTIIKTLETTNNIYLSGNSSLSALKVISPFSYYESVQDLNNLNVEGTIVYDIDTPISIIYTNCTVSRVINTGDGMVTITRINSTITDESDDEVETVVPISININVDSSTYVAIYKPDGTRYRYGSGNTTIILGAEAVTGEWSYKVAKYGYEFYSGTFLIDKDISSVTNIAPTLLIDSSVTITDVNTIIAYTDLNTTRKIYDYLSYYKTTSDGIIYGTFASRAIGSIILTKGLILDRTATSIASVASDILTVKSSGLNEEITIYTSGDFTLLNNSEISEYVKIRANNIDSELLVIGIEELVLYPSINARDTNTSRGPVITGNIFRFKYGSTIDGVLMQGTIYVRADVGAILLNEFLINIGNNVVDLGTFGQIQRVLFNQNIINDGIKKSSRLIPHSTDL
jgi:hypothetical protein